MKRLTTNKPVTEMGMWELAHNSCYVKDGKARYRDYSMDMDTRELAIKLLEKYADIPNEFTCDEDFDDFMLDSLQYGTDTILGLIAVFYRNLWAMSDLRERLKKYEDREESCEPRYLGENTAIGCRNGKCKCGNIVKSYQKYCDECGTKLEWGNVWAQRKENSMERLTQKDDTGYKLVMKSATECIGEDTDIKEWSVSRSAKGTQTIRGYAVDKLAEYENLEEQRKLLKLPCAAGDTVYRINPVSEEPVIEMTVTQIEIRQDGELVIYTRNTADGGELFYKCQESIDRTVFLTREDAEKAIMAEQEGDRAVG